MRSFAKPKSISLAPVLVSITFAGKRTFLEPGRERLVAEPRHAEVVRAVGVADVVDLTHGASAKRCQHFVGTEGTADWDGLGWVRARILAETVSAADAVCGPHRLLRNSAGQLSTMESGADNPSPVAVLTRKRWPSRVTA